MTSAMPDSVLVSITPTGPDSAAGILSLGVDINALGETIDRTALTAAAFVGNTRLIHDLVKNGAIVNQGNSAGVTALHEAASMDQVEAAVALLSLGANIEAVTVGGYTPLILAAAWDNVDVLKLLIAAGANLRHEAHDGLTPLDVAEEKHRDGAAAILRQAMSDRR